MNVLAIDTATEVLSVALQTGTKPEYGDQAVSRSSPLHRIRTATRVNGLKHSRTLLPLIAELVLDAGILIKQIDLIACTRGPGSFTGLRIGMATAKGLAAAIASSRGMADPPMISVPTLDVMASALTDEESVVVPVIDGRKGRFYAAVFRSQVRETVDLDLEPVEIVRRVVQSLAMNGVSGREKSLVVTGPHAERFISRLEDSSGLMVDPGFRRGYAANLISLAVSAYEKHGPDAQDQGPVYVRESDICQSRRVK